MPTCRDVSELATDYMEGTMTWRGKLGMRWHLGLCGPCRTHLEQLGKTKRLLARGTLPAPTAEVEDRLVAERGGGLK